MIELALNAAKFLLEKDTRDTVASLIAKVRESPEWRKAVLEISARIKRENKELVLLILDAAMDKMRAFEFPKSSISKFQVCFAECSRNTFEHGCRHDNDTIALRVFISHAYATMIWTNSPGRSFNFRHAIASADKALDINPTSNRGRGLLTIQHFADEVTQPEGEDAIKLLVFREAQEILYRVVKDVLVVRMTDTFYDLVSSEERHRRHRDRLEAICGDCQLGLIVAVIPDYLNSDQLGLFIDCLSTARRLTIPMANVCTDVGREQLERVKLTRASPSFLSLEAALSHFGRGDVVV